ncbi:MAG TPA: SMI1/KNR4 family protein [Pyrinomonadaceae bacterium]|nr:SMI1/KNR4 family protein [Pyrinomonadaceae bacterium]
MANFIDLFAKRVLDSGLSTYWSMSGCSQSEIQRLESTIDLKLPVEYEAFLRKMGHGAGRFMQGTDMFYPRLLDNRSAAEEALEREGFPFYLLPSMFVFSSHQGYIFHLFDCDTHLEDPPVLGFQEGEPALTRISDSFSQFLSQILDEEIRGWEQHRRLA